MADGSAMRDATKAALILAVEMTGCFSLLTKTDDLAGDGSDRGSSDGGVPSDAPRTDAGDADPSLVAYWPLDDGVGITAHDATGHGYDGELNRGASWTQGIRGGAVRFDRDAGGGIYAKVSGFGLSSVTVAAWVKSTDTASPQSRVYGLGTPAAYFFLNFNRGFPFVEAQTQAAYWGTKGAVLPSSIADDSWHHLALVLDRSTPEVRVYIDGISNVHSPPGVKDAGPDADDTFGDPSTTNTFVIGSQEESSAIEFGGVIDEVWVYRRALTPSEVARLAARP